MRHLFLLVGVVLLLTPLTYKDSVYSRTIYVDPANGNDNNPCDNNISTPRRSPAAALQTWSTACAAVGGDTIILKNGTYEGANTLVINCAVDSNNGSPGNPIVVKAENERQAFFYGNGSSVPFEVQNCSYYTFEGLRVENADYSSGGGLDNPGVGSAATIIASHHMIVKRFIVRFNNRYGNNAAFFYRGDASLFEENEIYDYHRYGLHLTGGTGNIFRRNYINSRERWDCTLPGCYGSANFETTRGDGGINIYAGPESFDNIMENNISEGNGGGFYLNCSYTNCHRTKLYGNISLGDTEGLKMNGGAGAWNPIDTYVENHVTINSISLGLRFGGTKNSVAVNTTTIGTEKDWGFNLESGGVGPPFSFAGKNILILNAHQTGFIANSDIDTWSVNSSNSFGNAGNQYSPASSGNYTNKLSEDAAMGQCYLWIPSSSPMKGRGVAGAQGSGGNDIGANVLYRYKSTIGDTASTLSNEPLWDTGTGKFPCGQTVSGVNSDPSTSCSGVHQRLHVGANNGCAFPAGYAQQVSDPPTLLAWWKLNEGVGTSAADAAGHGHAGTLTGTPLPAWQPGRIGPYGLGFDGQGGYVQVPGTLGTPPALTMSTWFRVAAMPTVRQELLSIGDSVGLYLQNGYIQCWYMSASGPGSLGTPMPAVLSTAHHLACSLDPATSTAKIYVDGQLVLHATSVSAPMAWSGPGSTTTIGRTSASATNPYTGYLDDPRIYNYRLSDADVQFLYRSTGSVPRHRGSMVR